MCSLSCLLLNTLGCTCAIVHIHTGVLRYRWHLTKTHAHTHTWFTMGVKRGEGRLCVCVCVCFCVCVCVSFCVSPLSVIMCDTTLFFHIPRVTHNVHLVKEMMVRLTVGHMTHDNPPVRYSYVTPVRSFQPTDPHAVQSTSRGYTK